MKNHKKSYGVMFHYFHDNKQFPKSQGSLSTKDLKKIINKIGIANINEPEEFILNPMFEQCAWRTGFRELRPEEKTMNGDLLFMSIGSPGLNHVAIFLDGDVLHHLTDRLSCREPYSQWLLKCTGGRYRYVA